MRSPGINMFKVGDKIIDNGKVYEIFKIKKEKTSSGVQEKIIYYEPYFENSAGNTLICSVPMRNLDKANIRRPISKKELKKVLKTLSNPVNDEKQIKVPQMRETLCLNNLCKTAQILKRLWVDKNNSSTNFSRTRQELFDSAMQRLIQEVALVDDLPLKEARRKIKEVLTEAEGEKVTLNS